MIRLFRTLAVLMLPLTCFGSAHGETKQELNLGSVVYPYPQSGVQIGQGWDSFNEMGTPAGCVNVEIAPLEVNSYSSAVEQMQSSYQYIKKVMASVSAAYNGGSFGGSGGASYSKQLRIDSDDQNFLFTFESSAGGTFAVPRGSLAHPSTLSEVDKALITSIHSPAGEEKLLNRLGASRLQVEGTSIAFSPMALTIINDFKKATIQVDRDELRERFKRLCGDGYVTAIHRGARAHLVLTQKVRLREEKESLAVSISASGYGASGSGSYSSTTQRTLNTNNLSYRLDQDGGIPPSVRAAIPPLAGATKQQAFDVNLILPTADNLLLNPTAFSIDIVPYTELENGEIFSQLFSSPNQLFTVADYYIALGDLYDLSSEIVKLSNSSAVYISTSFYEYNMLRAYDRVETGEVEKGEKGKAYDGARSNIQELRDQIQKDMIFLERLISECYISRLHCTVRDAFNNYKKDQVDPEIAKTDLVVERLSSAIKVINTAPEAGKEKIDLPGNSGLKDFVAQQLSHMGLPGDLRREDKLKYLNLLKDRLEAYREEAVEQDRFLTEDGELSPEFYLRFYHYAAALPLAKDTYKDFTKIKNMVVKADTAATPAVFDTYVMEAGDELRRAILRERLIPWKDFFCKEMKSAPLCVPDALLTEIAMPRLEKGDFVVKPWTRMKLLGHIFEFRFGKWVLVK
ncbi:hypothetical protein NKH09_15890 [Mesorhizobium sp. M1339]|uniref:hypothetical protein n=1 Tax=Mesorhizobium sp. M1339 TaxID=2957086 RepID=UPI00333A5AAA